MNRTVHSAAYKVSSGINVKSAQDRAVPLSKLCCTMLRNVRTFDHETTLHTMPPMPEKNSITRNGAMRGTEKSESWKLGFEIQVAG